MKNFKTLLLFLLAPYSALGAIEPGNYLFLHSKLVGCGEKTFLVGYAEVPEDGKVTLLDEYEISVIGQSADEIASQLARMIGSKTGHTPETLSIQVLPASEVKDIATELQKLAFPIPECRGPREPNSPPPDLEYVQSLANASHEMSGRLWPQAAPRQVVD